MHGLGVSREVKTNSTILHHTAVDLFGPFMIKDTVKRRTQGKVYGVICNCFENRAVYLESAEGYSALNC